MVKIQMKITLHELNTSSKMSILLLRIDFLLVFLYAVSSPCFDSFFIESFSAALPQSPFQSQVFFPRVRQCYWNTERSNFSLLVIYLSISSKQIGTFLPPAPTHIHQQHLLEFFDYLQPRFHFSITFQHFLTNHHLTSCNSS